MVCDKSPLFESVGAEHLGDQIREPERSYYRNNSSAESLPTTYAAHSADLKVVQRPETQNAPRWIASVQAFHIILIELDLCTPVKAT